MVILGEANLWTEFSENNSPEFVRQFMRRVRLKNFLRRLALYHYVVEVKLKAFYERHRSKFIPVDPKQDPLFKEQQQKDPDALFRQAIHDLCALAVTNGVKVVLLHLPTYDELIATNSPSVLLVKREISRDLHLPLVEMGPRFLAEPEAASTNPVPGNALYLEADPVHFTGRGNELIARRVVEAVAPLVTPGVPAAPAVAP